ncbi:MAG: putative deoxygenase [Paenibacillus sp.]|nr:putative deoxygenase [Paenibacillus sp.]
MIQLAAVEEHVQFFKQNGYVKIGRVLTDEELAALRAAADEQLHNPTGEVILEKGTDKPIVRRVSKLIQRNELFRNAAAHPLVVLFLGKLLGYPFEVCLNRHNMMMAKPAHHGGEVEWHQDARGWQCNKMLTMMLMLDDSTVQNGCLNVAPGIHLHPKFQNPEIRANYSEPQYREAIEHSVPIEAKAGEAYFFHSLTPHCSGANNSPNSRRSLNFAYIASADRHLIKPVGSFGELESIVIGPNGIVEGGTQHAG